MDHAWMKEHPQLDAASQREGYLTVGELAKRAGVTVRTLQYYDQEGLLSPSATDHQNHRLYSEGDVDELYRILILKFLGLTLSEIKVHKDSYGDLSLLRRLARQRLESTETEISRLLKTMTQLRELVEFASSEMPPDDIDWQRLASFLEDRPDSPEHFWRLISLTDNTQSDVDDERHGPERKKQIERWHGLIAQTIRLMQDGSDPASNEAQVALAPFADLLEDAGQQGGSMPDLLLMGTRMMGAKMAERTMPPDGPDGTFGELSRDVGDYLRTFLEGSELGGRRDAGSDDPDPAVEGTLQDDSSL